MDSKIIESLKNNNWMNYGGWTATMKEVAATIGYSEFIKRCEPDSWMFIPGGFKNFGVYCLRPDYAPEPELVERPIKKSDSGALCYYSEDFDVCYGVIKNSLSNPDFIGFKYEDRTPDGLCSAMARMYRKKGNPEGALSYTCCVGALENYEQVTPTHVLFRKGE